MSEEPYDMPHVPFLQHMDVKFVRKASGEAEGQLTIQRQHLRDKGILHGGVTAALLDSAMGGAAETAMPEGKLVVTVQLNVNYIRPGWPGETLRAIGRVRHKGRKTCVTAGEILTVDGELVATGSATLMVVEALS